MRSGIGSGEFTADATLAVETGAEDPNYVAAEMADLDEPSIPCRVTPSTGVVVLTAVYAADTTVQFVGLAHHNMTGAEDVQVELYSDAGMTALVDDTGAVAVPAPVADRPQCFPAALDAPVTIRAVKVTVTGLTGDLEVGVLLIGAWWEWPYISEGLDAGVTISGREIPLVGGGSIGAGGAKLRTRSLQIAYLDLAVATTTGIDFQKLHGLTAPHIYVEQYDDPTTWPRECFLARNDSAPIISAAIFGHGRFEYRGVEVI